MKSTIVSSTQKLHDVSAYILPNLSAMTNRRSMARDLRVYRPVTVPHAFIPKPLNHNLLMLKLLNVIAGGAGRSHSPAVAGRGGAAWTSPLCPSGWLACSAVTIQNGRLAEAVAVDNTTAQGVVEDGMDLSAL